MKINKNKLRSKQNKNKNKLNILFLHHPQDGTHSHMKFHHENIP